MRGYLCLVSAVLAGLIVSATPSPSLAAPYLYARTQLSTSVATYGGTYLEGNQPAPTEVWGSTVPVTATSPMIQTTLMDGVGKATATGTADWGVLKCYSYGAGGTYISGPDHWIAGGNGDATATFQDRWTISRDGLNGQAGTLVLTLNVEGTMTGWILHPGVNNGANWETRLNGDYNSSCSSWDYAHNTGRENAECKFYQPFTFGQPFEFSLSLSTHASGDYLNNLSVSDYQHSATLDSFEVRTSGGNPVADYTLVAASGHQYIPEPTSLALLGLSCVGVLIRRRTRHC